MTRNIKLFTFTGCFLALLLMIFSGIACASDTQKPVFKSIIVKPANASPGDTVTITVAATDNVGISHGLIYYEFTDGNEDTPWVKLTENFGSDWYPVVLTYDKASGNLIGRATIDKYAKPGIRQIADINILDTSNNCLKLTGETPGILNGNITISNPNPDITAPTIGSITVKTNASRGEKVHVIMDTSDSESGIEGAQVGWKLDFNEYLGCFLELNKLSGKLEGDLYIPLDSAPGKYRLFAIMAEDMKGNQSKWYLKGQAPIPEEKIYETEPLILADLEVSDSSSPNVAGFEDIKPGDWFAPDIITLLELGAINGFPDNTMRPSDCITRAEFAKMLCLTRGWQLDKLRTPSFNDVKQNHWAFTFIEAAKANGALAGYPGGSFYPEKSISRAEIAAALAKTLNLTPGDITLNDIASHWAKNSITACVDAGIISGYPDKTFCPNLNTTKAEASRMILKSIFPMASKPTDKKEYKIYDIDIYRDTPAWKLALAVRDQDIETIEKIASDNPKLLNYQDPKYGATLLLWAVGTEKYESAETLLKYGADPNIASKSYKSFWGESPLFLAAGYSWIDNDAKKDPKYVKLLLRYGADPNWNFVGGNGPEVKSVTEPGTSPLMESIPCGIEKTKALLEAGADINHKTESGETAAVAALLAGGPTSPGLIEYAHYLIVQKKAKVNEPYFRGKHFAMPGENPKDKFYPVDLLRDWTFDLGSKEYKIKMEIVKEFARQGVNYWNTEVPDSTVEYIKECYPNSWKEYLKKY